MTPVEAAREMMRRRELRQSFRAWCCHRLAPLGQSPARHHDLMIQELEALARGENDRLMILAPPGSAKSTYVSTLFPPWFMAQQPETAVIGASHTAELAERFGRRCRNLIAEDAGALGYELKEDSAAAGRWDTTNGGEYFAIGVGGAVSGRRANLLVCDDPVRSRAEADSQLVSDRTWEWWQADVLTRLKPNAKVVLVMTRWSEQDLGGRIEQDTKNGGKPWRILRIPMTAETDDPLGREPGELLWPEWFTSDMLAQAKRDARTYSALYQQRPVPEEGDYFHRDWLRPIASLPPLDSLRVVMGSDYAVTARGGDYTVHAVMGVDADDRLYLLDVWRAQASSDVWVDAWCDLVLRYRPIGAAEETGQIKSAIGPWLTKRQRERRAFTAREQFPTRGDKAVRAQSIRGRMASNGLYLPAAASWRAEVEAELLSFPAGNHDDIVDSLGLCGLLMDRLMPPGKVSVMQPKVLDGYERRRSSYRDDSDAAGWKVA